MDLFHYHWSRSIGCHQHEILLRSNEASEASSRRALCPRNFVFSLDGVTWMAWGNDLEIFFCWSISMNSFSRKMWSRREFDGDVSCILSLSHEGQLSFDVSVKSATSSNSWPSKGFRGRREPLKQGMCNSLVTIKWLASLEESSRRVSIRVGFLGKAWREYGAKHCSTTHMKHVFCEQTNDWVPTNEDRYEQIEEIRRSGETTLSKAMMMGNSPSSLIDRSTRTIPADLSNVYSLLKNLRVSLFAARRFDMGTSVEFLTDCCFCGNWVRNCVCCDWLRLEHVRRSDHRHSHWEDSSTEWKTWETIVTWLPSDLLDRSPRVEEEEISINAESNSRLQCSFWSTTNCDMFTFIPLRIDRERVDLIELIRIALWHQRIYSLEPWSDGRESENTTDLIHHREDLQWVASRENNADPNWSRFYWRSATVRSNAIFARSILRYDVHLNEQKVKEKDLVFNWHCQPECYEGQRQIQSFDRRGFLSKQCPSARPIFARLDWHWKWSTEIWRTCRSLTFAFMSNQTR